MSEITWSVINSKADKVATRILDGFYIPKTWEEGDETTAIAGMLTQFLFVLSEITIHEITEASLDSDNRYTGYWIFFNDGSKIALKVKEYAVSDYPGYLINIPSIAYSV